MRFHWAIGKLAAILIPAWLVAGVFGDELFALVYFRDVDAAMGFSMGRPWWWIYQVIIALVFIVTAFVLSRIRYKEQRES